MNTTLSAPTITEALCEVFASAADLLLQRRAAAIAERDLDDFVALGWMDWRGSLVIARSDRWRLSGSGPACTRGPPESGRFARRG